MNLFVETVIVILQYFYYTLTSIIWALTPARFLRKDVAGQTVLITGAGSGLGRLMATRFAKLGCTLVLWDLNQTANEQTADEVRRFGATAHAYTCDLSKREEIYSVADKVKEEVGDIDILVNNAGIVTGKKLMQCSDDLMVKTMDVNVNAHFWTTKCFLPAMLRRNQGHIVSIASAAGLFGVTGLCDYSASKHAAVGFNEALLMELDKLGKDGIKTTVVCPYYINTGMFEGVVTRFPKLMPIVEPEHAVDRIMDGVLCDSYMVCIPRIVYLLYALKGISAVKSGIIASRFVGVSNCMDDFKGREKQD